MRPSVIGVFRSVLTLGLALLATACETTQPQRADATGLWPELRLQRGPAAEDPSPAPSRVESDPVLPTAQPFRQDGRPLHASGARAHASRSGGGIELAFDDTPVAEVVSIVIGDMLGAGFVIDPAVEGRITLRSAGPVPEADLPHVLDRALRLNGLTLSQEPDGSYTVARVGRDEGGLSAPRLAAQGVPVGEGVLVVPLSHIGAQAMAQILQPYTRSGAQALPDDRRSMLVLTGDAPQLEAMLGMVELFDVDWLAGMSVALYPLEIARPDAMVAELYSVMGGRDGPAGSQIEFVALNRLNALVALTSSPDRLDDIETWIRRLDVRPAHNREVRVRTLANSDALAVADHLNELFGGEDGMANRRAVTVRADEASNSLLIAAGPADQEEIETVVGQIDRAPDQVLIEALIVEVVLTDDLQYGVQWFLDTRDGGAITSTSTESGSIASRFPGFSYTYDSDFVRAALNAISSLTDVETLSSPQIVLRNNSSATVQVGDQVPVITQSAVSVADPDAPIVNSIQFRDTGVTLQVRARIDPAGLIVLDVVQEVSSVAETTTSGIDSPTIQQRRLESSVSLYDGEAVVLGGLIRSQQTRSRSGVPGLQRVPGVGTLFSDTTNRGRRTELLVFLTPHILRTREDTLAVTQALRDRMDYLRLQRRQSDAQ